MPQHSVSVRPGQPSEQAIDQLLTVLVARKPGDNFLELGTGIGPVVNLNDRRDEARERQ